MNSNDFGFLTSRTTTTRLERLIDSKTENPEMRIQALKLISRKKGVDTGKIFSRITKSKTESAVFKSNLILDLGPHLKSPKKLENLLGQESPLVERSVLHTLAYKGNPDSIKRLDTYIKKNKAKKALVDKAKFAKMMISYRLGLDENVLHSVRTSNFETFRGVDSINISKKKLNSTRAKEIIQNLDIKALAVPLSSQYAQSLSCQNNKLAVLLNEQVPNGQFNFETNGILATITQEDYCPEGHFVKYHVLVNRKARSNDYSMHLIDPKGRIRLAGSAKKKGDLFDFDVKSLKRPGGLPIRFKGVLDLNKKDLGIEEARSATSIRKSTQIQLLVED